MARRAIPLLRPHRGLLGLGVAFLLVSVAAELAGPIVLRRLIDHDIAAGSRAGILRSAAIYAALFIIGTIAGYFQVVVLTRMGLRIVTTIKKQLFDHLLGLSLAYFDKNPPGRLIARVESDGERLQMLFSEVALAIARTVILFLGTVAVMLRGGLARHLRDRRALAAPRHRDDPLLPLDARPLPAGARPLRADLDLRHRVRAGGADPPALRLRGARPGAARSAEPGQARRGAHLVALRIRLLGIPDRSRGRRRHGDPLPRLREDPRASPSPSARSCSSSSTRDASSGRSRMFSEQLNFIQRAFASADRVFGDPRHALAHAGPSRRSRARAAIAGRSWPSRTSPSSTTAGQRRSTTSPSGFAAGRRSRSSASRAAARRRSRTCCCASTSRPRDASRWTGATSAPTGRTPGARRSGSCCRRSTSFRGRSRRTCGR